MPDIWFTSDTHAFHKNITKGVSSWKDGHMRDFENEVEMTQVMADNFNAVVNTNDIIYHLGDWSFGGEDKIRRFRDMINCQNIYLVYGNHDHHIWKNDHNKKLFLGCYDKMEISLFKQRFFLFHYALKVWNKSHHGSIHLYGHSHGSLPDDYTRSMDVGVDTNGLTPYHLDDVLAKLGPRPAHSVDHHNEGTN